MLDKGPWSHALDGVFPASCDNGLVKEVTCISSEETKASNHCLKSGNIGSVGSEFDDSDLILGEKGASNSTDTYSFSLGQISQTDGDLNFFDNDREDKENGDLLYYGWPDDIGNFEDVDRMFRSCDSTFGLGSLSNEDDLCWFSSSHSTEGSEDAMMLGSKLPSSEGSALNCVSDYNEAPKLTTAGPLVIETNKKILLIGDKASSNADIVTEHSEFGHLQFSNGSGARSVHKDDLMLEEQISSHKSQVRHRNFSEGKRKEWNLENGSSVHCNGNFKKFSDSPSSLVDPSSQVFSPAGAQQHKQSIGSDSLNYMQTSIPFMHKDYDHSPDQTSVSASQSGIKSECNGLPSPSPKESSSASNQVKSMESSHGPLLEAPAITNENREKLYHRQNLQTHYANNFKCANVGGPAAFYDSVQNQTHQSEYEVEGQSEIEAVSTGIPTELDSSNAQESSCMSSVLDEISIKASSFRQLQQVMEQLDTRTKLCIRDSLYRLARSAEQRHNCVNANGGKRDDRDTSGPLMAEETNKGTAFLDIETDTNPIDRSIAHLLFHRPSDPSAMPTNDALSLKSHTMAHGSITSRQMMAKKQVCQEETVNGADKSFSMSGNKS